MKTAAKGYDSTMMLDGLELSYDDLGSGMIPIIFLHGFPFDKSMWAEQLEFFKSSYRVIACDIRGFGKSEDEKSILNIQLFTDDLIEFMDKLNIEKAILCGLSMGGYIALNAQKRFPDRFAALILCDTQCIADSPETMEKRVQAIVHIRASGVDDFNEGFIKSVFFKDSLSNKKELVEQLRKVVYSNSPHAIISGLIAIAGRLETCTTLYKITIPTLIICGKADQVTPLEQSKFMHTEIKDSVLRVIDNAGHVSNLEQPEEFNQYILHFLADLNGIGMANFNV